MSFTVLVVDDEADVRLVIAQLIKQHGWHVHEASDGEAGLELCEEVGPDAIVLDYKMPGLSGVDVASRLRESGYRGFIVLYSAYLTPTIESEAADLGAWAVAKPDLDELFHLLTDAIGGNGRRSKATEA